MNCSPKSLEIYLVKDAGHWPPRWTSKIAGSCGCSFPKNMYWKVLSLGIPWKIGQTYMESVPPINRFLSHGHSYWSIAIFVWGFYNLPTSHPQCSCTSSWSIRAFSETLSSSHFHTSVRDNIKNIKLKPSSHTHLPSGKHLHNYGKIHHAING